MIDTGRATSFAAALNTLRGTFPDRPVVIVETGCVRSLEDDFRMGDGWSTYHWLGFCRDTGSTLYSVDVDPHAIRQATRLREIHFPGESIDFRLVQGDSVGVLAGLQTAIHLLYLDSYDFCGDEANVARCHAHNLAEAVAALPKMDPRGFVLIDDVFDWTWTGKGQRTIPFLFAQGFHLLHRIDNQVLLQREVGS